MKPVEHGQPFEELSGKQRYCFGSGRSSLLACQAVRFIEMKCYSTNDVL
jgi:hypothetical protein